MAGNTISMTFKLDVDNKTFQDLVNGAEGLKKAMTAAVEPAEQLKARLINFAALATGFKAVQESMGQLQGVIKGLADIYAEQEVNDRKLETTMRNSMDATDGEIQKIKELCAAQEQQGVVSASVQTAAAQELATYLGLSSSLETLIPVLNDMTAQQYGVSASAESATTITTMLGKVMNGQVSALSRYGYTFDEVQEKILKFGTEEERAAVLADVVGASVGGMNAQLAQTDSGKQKQLADRIDAIKASIGQLAGTAMPFVTMASEATTALTSIGTLASGIKTLTTTLYTGVKALAASTAALLKERVAALAAAAAKKTVAAATVAWTAVQKVLNLVLTANPIGLIVTAIGALVAGLVAAYNNCEGFRNAVNRVWEAIKPLADGLMNLLGAALDWLAEKIKVVVD